MEVGTALPRDRKEARAIDVIVDGPIWRLIGNVLAYEQHGGRELSPEDENRLIGQYYQAYRALCEKNDISPVALSAINCAYVDQRLVRKVPEGKSAVEWAVEQAKIRPDPDAEKEFSGDEARKLLYGVCVQLSLLGRDGRFYLGCRCLEKHLGIKSYQEWSTILNQFCSLGILERVFTGGLGSRKASEYRFTQKRQTGSDASGAG